MPWSRYSHVVQMGGISVKFGGSTHPSGESTKLIIIFRSGRSEQIAAMINIQTNWYKKDISKPYLQPFLLVRALWSY